MPEMPEMPESIHSCCGMFERHRGECSNGTIVEDSAMLETNMLERQSKGSQ